uniref:Zf-CCHC domain-containing protein/UBN2 domain-containing protein n=1 Tax=Tanacetum cinerariifolium TaxID=118510 RepID=A0A6L2NJL9_TANCI|nr:hypothetical protein [Tanacetum cinerariifolium]
MAIKKSKDLTSLSLDELIRNLKVHEMIIKKDSEVVKAKVERKSIALKAKKESSDEECLTSGSEDEEYAMTVMAIKKSKDLTSLSLDELIRNLKVHEMIIKKDSEVVKAKVERKSIALKAKKESSDEECLTSGSEDEECGDPNHLIGECPKPPKDKNQRAFVGGSWSDSGEEDDEKVKDETCLVDHASSEVCSESSYISDENSSIDDLALDNEYDKL